MVTLSSVVFAPSCHASCDLGGGETAVLALRNGEYFGLHGVASFIWQAIREPTSVRVILDALLRTYDVLPSVCEKDLLAFLSQLERRGLIEITNEAS